MGVKRTKNSGRRDSLGREIKVSGNASERAPGSSVDGGESGVRSDFAPGDHCAPGIDLDSFLETSRVLRRYFDDLYAKYDYKAPRLISDEMIALMDEQVDALSGEVGSRGRQVLADPEFLAAHKVLVAQNTSIMQGTGSDVASKIFDLSRRLEQINEGDCWHYKSSLVPEVEIDVPPEASDDEIVSQARDLAEMIDAEKKSVALLIESGITDEISLLQRGSVEWHGYRVASEYEDGDSRWTQIKRDDDGMFIVSEEIYSDWEDHPTRTSDVLATSDSLAGALIAVREINRDHWGTLYR